MDDLLTLPGVGRKTANVVLGTCFGAASIVVDTHFRRVTQRLGLAKSDDPDEIERELAALLPPAGLDRLLARGDLPWTKVLCGQETGSCKVPRGRSV